MSNSINTVQDEIIAEFSKFSDWEQKYNHLIKLGKNLEAMSEEDKLRHPTRSSRRSGCAGADLIIETKVDIILFESV